MELLTLPVVAAAILVALLSRAVRSLLLRAIFVVAAAYGVAFISVRLASHFSSDDQFDTWAPLLFHFSFAVGSVVGIVVLLVSNWLLRPRKRHAE